MSTTTMYAAEPLTARRLTRAVHRRTRGMARHMPAETRAVCDHVTAGDYSAALTVAREIYGDDELVGFDSDAKTVVNLLESAVAAFATAAETVLG